MERKDIRTVLLGVPAALITVGGFAAIWEAPRDWIGTRFSDLAAAMDNPFVAMLVTLLAVAYFAAVAWTFLEPRVVPVSGAALREAEAAKERQERRRKILDDARAMVAKHELQTRWSWEETMRYTPAFAAVRPHLKPEFFKQSRTVIVAGDKPIYEYQVEQFVRELDRLEREWGLS